MTTTPLFTLVDELAARLTGGSALAEEVATSLGTLDDGDTGTLYVSPSLALLRQIIVLQDDGGETSYVELILAEGQGPELEAITTRYGEYTVLPRVSFSQPHKLIIRLPDGPAYGVSLVVDVEDFDPEPDPDDEPEDEVVALSLRREPLD